MKNRIYYFDFLRGIAILMVIGIHTFVYRQFDSLGHVFEIALRESFNFAVPLFLTISGFFIGRKCYNKSEDYLYLLKKQVIRVYLPAILWSIPMVIWKIIKGYDIGASLVKGVVLMSFDPYYFVILVMQFYVLTPILVRLSLSKWGGVIIVAINAAFVFILNYFIESFGLTTMFLVGPFVYWIVFYYIGIKLSMSNRDYGIKIPLVLIIIGFVAQMIETYFLMSLGHFGIGIKVSAWIYAAGMVLFFFSNKVELAMSKVQGWAFRKVVTIGRFSFGIYLLHVYVLIVLSIINGRNIWLVNFCIVVAISLLFLYSLLLIIPDNYIKRIGLI